MKKDKIKGGKADNLTVKDIAKKFDVSVDSIEKQLEMGIKVEMEHVDDEELSKEIAMDHLVEFPDYYTRLEKMENEAEKEWELKEQQIRYKIRTLLMEQITFSGVFIEDPTEIEKLKMMSEKNMAALGLKIPSHFIKNKKDFHMTVKLGQLPLGLKMRNDIGKEVELDVRTIGVSDEAIALGVSGYMSKNDHQHITLGFRDVPSASKDIENWIPLPFPFKLTGVIREK